ncbi:patatin-like phospholipase family protein [Flavobacterium sp. D11R37]|uniref:patatin-like phospholipase family protein n=1 Tax=Flavobacterium coralii TaxID=2838017 RepID=UPI001CA6FDE5|nr:patatin-like phospholipase family protein [Flavobacterium coralii]MBY8963660.1 patatin-like phospholipase family protein [Flavobacterium coralii]
MRQKTKHFQNCLGVFQGGGCKASAYVGAYQEATDWGVSFSELVGTSAGSIVAVLIGAGASPSDLERMIKELDFKKFISPAKKIGTNKLPIKLRIAKHFIDKKWQEYLPVVTYFGMHNSENIKDWLEAKLQELLPDVPKPIKFKDLIIPTSVIVTDIITKRVEVFSTEKSSSKDVSEAVQASCNIPIYFQPVEMRYVDGGILSNLPTFIFENHPNRNYDKILAFSLESRPVISSILNIEDYLRALVNTALEGNLDIQLSLQENIHLINIDTGDISATDFDKINSHTILDLINRGKVATNDFFKNETINVGESVKRWDITFNSYFTKNYLIQNSSQKFNQIIICDTNNKDWVYDLFPTLLKWKNDKSEITFIFPKDSDDTDNKKFRIRFLNNFGVRIHYVGNLPFRGAIFDGAEQDNCKAILFNHNEGNEYHAKIYSGVEDSYVIGLMHNMLKDYVTRDEHTRVKLSEVDHNELIANLRQVKQYSNENVQVTIRKINVCDVIFLTKYVLGYKYRQIKTLFDLYDKFGFDYFRPTKLVLSNDKYTLVTPPILEIVDQKLYLIDGNTRFTYAYRNGIESLTCVVVENVNSPFPTKDKFLPKEILLSDKKREGDTRYNKFDYSKYRKIEECVRNPKNCLL